MAACGGDDAAVPDPPGAIDQEDDASGAEPGEGSGAEMPPELADFPLPDDATVPFPALEAGDDRDTLAVAALSRLSPGEVVQIIDAGLEAAGYEIESREVADEQGVWEFTKEGVPGNVTAGANAGGEVTININLFRAGIR